MVRYAKLKAYNDLYTKLGTQEGEKSIYKLAKLRDRKTKDFNNVKCIQNDDSRVLVKDDEIMERWKNYFERLLNGDNGSRLDIEELRETREDIFFRRIRTTEVRIALKKMKTGKALGPDGIPIEVWKCLGEDGVSWLIKLFNRILMTNRMPDEWRKSVLVPIYKNKGDTYKVVQIIVVLS